jgi:hypothetical protein
MGQAKGAPMKWINLSMRGIVVCILISLSSCNLPTPADIASTPTASPIPGNTVPVSSPTPSAPAAHRIGIRLINGAGEFYDRTTSEKFVPRGMNYIRLAWQTKADGSRTFGHSLFDPSQYDHSRADNALIKMHADGYNVVRVFLSPDTMGTESGGLAPAYMENITDFLNSAKANQMYVMFTLDWIPGGKYGEILNADCCTTFALMNANFLPPAGLKANQAFYQDFIGELNRLGAPTEYIFSYELRNEMFFDGDQPPLSLTSGSVTTANGKSYDMSKPDDKQRMLDENLVYWIDSMRASILQVDYTALVSVGFFQPQSPNPTRIGDPRIAVTQPAIWQSKADFIDLHPYPGSELSLKQYVENYGIQDMQTKPILMGEFGGEVKRFASLDTAVQRFVDWQVESCKYGFDGWLFWTWDLTEQPDFFNALMGNSQIEKALAPVTRPDPCLSGATSTSTTNLALNASAKASRSLSDQPPGNAIDGSPETQWGAGSGPTQWIEIDLGSPHTIESLRLTTAQYPDGNTIHQLWARGANGDLKLIHEFNGYTSDNQILEFKPEAPLTEIQYIRIVTTQSPSWVAWKEIEVFGK